MAIKHQAEGEIALFKRPVLLSLFLFCSAFPICSSVIVLHVITLEQITCFVPTLVCLLDEN